MGARSLALDGQLSPPTRSSERKWSPGLQEAAHIGSQTSREPAGQAVQVRAQPGFRSWWAVVGGFGVVGGAAVHISPPTPVMCRHTPWLRCLSLCAIAGCREMQRGRGGFVN